MGDIGEMLFGKEEEAKPMRVSKLTDSQMALLNQLAKLVGGQIGEPGERVPGAGELQQQYFGALAGEDTGGMGSAIQQTGEYLDRLLSTEYDPAEARDYWEQAYKKPMMQTWEQEIMPGIAEKYAGAGAVSSSGFNRAMGQAATDMQTQLGGQLAGLEYKGQQAHEARQMQGADLSRQLAQLLGQAGQQQRGIETQQWQTQQPWANPWLQQLDTMLNTTPYETYMQPAYREPGELKRAGRQFMGGFGYGMGMKYSDKRLKKNIIRLI